MCGTALHHGIDVDGIGSIMTHNLDRYSRRQRIKDGETRVIRKSPGVSGGQSIKWSV